MIRTLHLSTKGVLRLVEPAQLSAELLRASRGTLWLDFEGEPVETCEPILRDVFRFHPLAIDDALRETHIPKLDDWGDYLYIAFHAVEFDLDGGSHVNTSEVDFFLGGGYLVSHHDEKIPVLDKIWDRCDKDRRILGEGADHTLYVILDELVESYMGAFQEIDEAVDALEDEILESSAKETLGDIFKLKRALVQLRRTLAPQREVLTALARGSYSVIDARDRVYFRDVYDHLVRMFDINESMRDQVGGALETYLSATNNRMNEIMKTLTVITTLFMPISFIASFFGMNFFSPAFPLEHWTGRTAFGLMMVFTVTIPVSFYVWARRRGWVGK
jgi:magnesium transporter